jgi:phenylalanyl-tRNA synthetase alpha subunit
LFLNRCSSSVFSYHDGLKKWVEVGNSGMFRPEMLLPMGLPEGVNVIAWGLSLERYMTLLARIEVVVVYDSLFSKTNTIITKGADGS